MKSKNTTNFCGRAGACPKYDGMGWDSRTFYNVQSSFTILMRRADSTAGNCKINSARNVLLSKMMMFFVVTFWVAARV